MNETFLQRPEFQKLGEQKIAGSRYINEYFSDKDPGGAAYSNASSTLVAPNDTR